jgi:hypothetical protein
MLVKVVSPTSVDIPLKVSAMPSSGASTWWSDGIADTFTLNRQRIRLAIERTRVAGLEGAPGGSALTMLMRLFPSLRAQTRSEWPAGLELEGDHAAHVDALAPQRESDD